MTRTLLLISVFLIIPALAVAFTEPIEFRGLKFGEDLTQAIQECPHRQGSVFKDYPLGH